MKKFWKQFQLACTIYGRPICSKLHTLTNRLIVVTKEVREATPSAKELFNLSRELGFRYAREKLIDLSLIVDC